MARVLVADDAMFIRHLIGDLLQSHGHEIVGEAQNGIEAVEQFERLRPDVMTLDITMPEMDGLSALEAILAVDADARIIMCSALKDRDKVLHAVRAGARDFVLKPVRRERVLEAVDKALSS